jgi:uncharacterized RDD family membrane protein YckC
MGQFSLWHWIIVIAVLFLIFRPDKLIARQRESNEAKVSIEPTLNTTPKTDELATLWSRIGGAIVDLIIVFSIAAALMFVWGVVSGLNQEMVTDEVWKGRGFLLGLMVDCLITVVTMSGAKQSTFGQRAVGIRTVRIDGQKITYGTAFVRYFVSIISSVMLKLGFAIAIFTKNRRTLHDLAAGTIVVKE